MPCPPPGNLPDSGIEPATPALQADSLLLSHWGSPSLFIVQSLSCVRLCASPWTVACQASPCFTISQSLLKLMSIELVMSSNYLILCHPLLLLLQSCPASGSFPMSQLFASPFILSAKEDSERVCGEWIDSPASLRLCPKVTYTMTCLLAALLKLQTTPNTPLFSSLLYFLSSHLQT